FDRQGRLGCRVGFREVVPSLRYGPGKHDRRQVSWVQPEGALELGECPNVVPLLHIQLPQLQISADEARLEFQRFQIGRLGSSQVATDTMHFTEAELQLPGAGYERDRPVDPLAGQVRLLFCSRDRNELRPRGD